MQMLRHITSRLVGSHSAALRYISITNRALSSLVATSTNDRASRCAASIADLSTTGLYDIMNKSKVLKAQCSLHNPYPQAPANHPKKKLLEGVNIGLLFCARPPKAVSDMNLIRVLELFGAKVVVHSASKLAVRQRGALKLADKPLPDDAASLLTVSLAADFISTCLSRAAACSTMDTQDSSETPSAGARRTAKRKPTKDEPLDLILAIHPTTFYRNAHDKLVKHAGLPVISLHSTEAALLSVLGLLQAYHDVAPSLFNAKVGVVGSGNNPFVYELIRAAQMLQFGITVGCPNILSPDQALVDAILSARYERPVTGEELPAAVFEVTSHPFIAAAQADLIVTDTIVPHTSWKGRPSHPLHKALVDYEVDKEMLSVAKDTVRLAHVTSGMHDWVAPPLGTDDARCLWSAQLNEENYALVSLCLWALNKELK